MQAIVGRTDVDAVIGQQVAMAEDVGRFWMLATWRSALVAGATWPRWPGFGEVIWQPSHDGACWRWFGAAALPNLGFVVAPQTGSPRLGVILVICCALRPQSTQAVSVVSQTGEFAVPDRARNSR